MNGKTASGGTEDETRRAPSIALARAACFVLGGSAALVLLLLGAHHLDPRPLAQMRLEGQAVPQRGSLGAYLQRRADLWASESLTLEAGYHLFRPTRATLGAELPVVETAAQIRQLGRGLNPLVVLRAWWRAQYGAGHDLRWRPRIVDYDALDQYVRQMREQVDRLPTAASSDAAGARVDGLSGEALDVEATRRAIERALVRGDKWLKVATVVTPPIPAVRRFTEPRESATLLMMRQETEYRANNHGRATNIELSARKLDGAVLMPGAALSFNRVVGKRTQAAGFAPAQELLNGEVTMGIGGGVCQTAGTLHAAAFFAGLIVEEHRPHSRLSQLASLRPGLDTMVAWPDHVTDLGATKDMRIRNPYPFPIVVRTAIVEKPGGRSTLRIELYGSARPFRVDWSFEELERIPARELRRVDASLRRGEVRVQQEALSGSVILRRRTIYMPTRRIEEAVRIRYPPIHRVLLVGES